MAVTITELEEGKMARVALLNVLAQTGLKVSKDSRRMLLEEAEKNGFKKDKAELFLNSLGHDLINKVFKI